ncbi:unnamed protein product [Ceutorhynchus assimilis]|uniref:B box-type domain-containing protein n=1 Tax=Ceutorhynchus assimilis TaxID=467358 RepID=A0A9N9QL72_9CUCU|nr:unnamed protein product [Ceutorhynchus assimilis]
MDGPDLVKCGAHDLKNYLYCMQCYTDLCAMCYQTHPENHEVEPLDEALRKIRQRHEPLLECEDLTAVEDRVKNQTKPKYEQEDYWTSQEVSFGWYEVNYKFVPQVLEHYQVCALHPFTDPGWYLNCATCGLKLCYQCFCDNGFTLEAAHYTFVQYHNMTPQNSHEFAQL